MNQPLTIALIGGSGFLGAYVARELAKRGHRLRIVCRNPQAEAAARLKTCGNLGQVALVYGDLGRPETLAIHLRGVDVVVNLVGVLYEKGGQRFQVLHANGAEKLAQMAHVVGVRRFVQVSALGVDKAADAAYARTKLAGEHAVRAAFPEAVILRPGVLFGAEDNFFNQFACMARFSPALPLFNGGDTRFQPAYVGDVAAAVAACVEDDMHVGRTYELGGSDVFTFRQLMEFVLRQTHRRRLLLPMPMGLARLLAAVLEKFPRPPLTRDQLRLLAHDNLVSPDALTFAQIGIRPQAVGQVVPEYLARFRRRSHHA